MLTYLISIIMLGSACLLPPSEYFRQKSAKKAPPQAAPVVKGRLVVSVGRTVPLQMSTKRPIKTVFNSNDRVVRVQASPIDPTTVLVTGLMPGRALITLTDADGKKQVCKVGR
jgi:hypothetical protein